jgi:ribosomal protein RSM22 (predicted rRNA methylase)
VYLQRNLAAHVAQTKHVLRKTVLKELSEVDSTKAASLGGGPGVECLALADSLEGTECRKLTFSSFDIEASWRSFFDDLTSTIGGRFKTLQLGAKFVSRNIIEQGTKNQYDVVFVPWVLSELGVGMIPTFVEHAVNACRIGGHVVVLERKESNLGATVVTAFQASDSVTRVFDAEDEVQGHCGVTVPQSVCEKFKPKLNYQSLYYAFRRDG